MPLRPAEQTLLSFGIERAEHIDVEAIALCLGVKVRRENLVGCEARLVGFNDRAIVSVRATSRPERQRFSIAHELGHWHFHRGRSFSCRADDYGESVSKPEEERIADAYAADLLMPPFIFRPAAIATNQRYSFGVVMQLAEMFQTSVTATALRLVDMNVVPSMLICHGQQGRKWFRRSKDVPSHWFPKSVLESDTFAFDALFAAQRQARPQKIGAESWFDRRGAERFDVYEHSILLGQDVFTLLLFEDEEMLDESRACAW